MALGDFLKKKKEIPPPGARPPTPMPQGLQRNMMPEKESPEQLVMRLQRQGMSYQDIMAAMRREGYSQTQISDAFDHASQMNQNQNNPYAQNQQQNNQAPMPPPPMPDPQGNNQMMPPPMQHQSPSQTKMDQIDELIERTVEEKWEQFSDRIKELDQFKASMESRLANVETQLERLDTKFDNLKNAVIAKIKDYDTSILNVRTEMKAMEQVFQKILPDLQQNVSELGRITGKMSSPSSRTQKK